MSIDVVVGDVAVLAFSDGVGQLADGVQVDVGLEKKHPLGRRQTLVGSDLLLDLVEFGRRGRVGHS